MDELEITQPEENQEGSEAVESIESAEEQALSDATHEPGAVIEQTQTFEQAEAIESALTEAVDNIEPTYGGPGPPPPPDEGVDHADILTKSPPNLGYEEAPPGGGPPSVEGLPITMVNEAQGVDSSDMDIADLPIPVFNKALEDEGDGDISVDPKLGDRPPAETNDPPDPKGPNNVAIDPGPMSKTPHTEGPNIELSPDDVKKGGAQTALTPDDVKKGASAGNEVGENPDEGGSPPGPNLEGQESL